MKLKTSQFDISIYLQIVLYYRIMLYSLIFNSGYCFFGMLLTRYIDSILFMLDHYFVWIKNALEMLTEQF
jgi:hypothetical protein